MRNRNRKSSVSTGILLFTVGGIFTAIGIAIFVITVKGLIGYSISVIGAGIIMPIMLILALLGFGITALVMGGRKIYLWIRQSKTSICGNETYAKITDSKSTSFSESGKTRIRYALVISYEDGIENKNFTTDYIYDVNECRYLKKLEKVKVLIDGDFVTVCEPFPKEIYKVDSVYGIDFKFYRQKPVKIIYSLWMTFFFAAIVFLILSFFVGNGKLVLPAIITIFAVHFPFVIPMAIYLIKWYTRKK